MNLVIVQSVKKSKVINTRFWLRPVNNAQTFQKPKNLTNKKLALCKAMKEKKDANYWLELA